MSKLVKLEYKPWRVVSVHEFEERFDDTLPQPGIGVAWALMGNNVTLICGLLWMSLLPERPDMKSDEAMDVLQGYLDEGYALSDVTAAMRVAGQKGGFLTKSEDSGEASGTA